LTHFKLPIVRRRQSAVVWCVVATEAQAPLLTSYCPSVITGITLCILRLGSVFQMCLDMNERTRFAKIMPGSAALRLFTPARLELAGASLLSISIQHECSLANKFTIVIILWVGRPHNPQILRNGCRVKKKLRPNKERSICQCASSAGTVSTVIVTPASGRYRY
jgi:hypothetical protein